MSERRAIGGTGGVEPEENTAEEEERWVMLASIAWYDNPMKNGQDENKIRNRKMIFLRYSQINTNNEVTVVLFDSFFIRN
jgi:hypothetical protein